MDVTVAICTWNRADLLEQTLARMHELRVSKETSWELLIVNNCCTDDTDTVIARHADKLPIRRLHEPRQGHSHARNCAVAAARGDLLIWTDDDVLVDPNWLEAYARAARNWPTAAIFGGVIDPWFSRKPPGWILRHLPLIDNIFAVRQLGTEDRALGPWELPYGANLAFRTSVLREFPFNTTMGHTGGNLFGGEETELVNRMREAGHRGVWVGTARVRHYIPPERLTEHYVFKYLRAASERECRLRMPTPGPRLWRAPRWIWRLFLTFQFYRYLLTPLRNEKWMRMFMKAAYFRGVIDAEQKRADAYVANCLEG
jgi:glucosyl-dolichyl phosphate glucuronosyltransferase